MTPPPSRSGSSVPFAAPTPVVAVSAPSAARVGDVPADESRGLLVTLGCALALSAGALVMLAANGMVGFSVLDDFEPRAALLAGVVGLIPRYLLSDHPASKFLKRPRRRD